MVLQTEAEQQQSVRVEMTAATGSGRAETASPINN